VTRGVVYVGGAVVACAAFAAAIFTDHNGAWVVLSVAFLAMLAAEPRGA